MGPGYVKSIFYMAFLFMLSQSIGCRQRSSRQNSEEGRPEVTHSSVDITPVMQGAKLLDEAIDALLGLDSIKGAQQWVARTTGTYMGMPYSGVTTFNGSSMRMDIKTTGGGEMSFVMGGKNCWSRIGPVVTSCSNMERRAYKEQFTWENAARLYLLKQEGWVTKKEETKVGDKKYPTLLISNRSLKGEGRLVFDPRSKLLVKSFLPMVFIGKRGIMESDMLDYRKECGTMMPYHVISVFDGKKVMEDEVEEYFCGHVQEDLFPEPLQVADGTFSQYTTGAKTAFCTTLHYGALDIGSAMGKLTEKVAEKKWTPMGPLFSVWAMPLHLAGNERKSEMELCVPVSVPAPGKPRVSGEYVLKAFPSSRVLAVYGLGDYAAQFERLSKLLDKEMTARKLKKNGNMILVFHHDPSNVANDKLVSELQAPIE